MAPIDKDLIDRNMLNREEEGGLMITTLKFLKILKMR